MSTSDSNVPRRFAFGENWNRYISGVGETQIAKAEESLRSILQLGSLQGQRFLDIGSGSGLFSLAARRLGASVYSFDFDEMSVHCAEELKSRFDSNHGGQWTISRGSILDDGFVNSLGQFDIVYSWGVLHHTGEMWRAIRNAMFMVRPGGLLCIAIYNDQGLQSRLWSVVKKTYNRLPAKARFTIFWPAFVRLWGPTFLKDLFRGTPFKSWNNYVNERGMSPMVDVTDWVGGYPFEVATPEAVVSFCGNSGFVLKHSICRNGIGCNEFTFTRRLS